MNVHKTIALPFGITIDVSAEEAALVSSDLRTQLVDADDSDGGVHGEIAANAVEALLLSLVAAGVDLSGLDAQRAVETAVEAIANNLV